jgi:hypothetical protein
MLSVRLAAEGGDASDRANLVRNRNMLSMPKLLDVCVLYGHDNPALTRQLVEQARTPPPPFSPQEINICMYCAACCVRFLYIAVHGLSITEMRIQQMADK